MTTKLGPFTREWFSDCRALAARGEQCSAYLAAQVIDELEIENQEGSLKWRLKAKRMSPGGLQPQYPRQRQKAIRRILTR